MRRFTECLILSAVLAACDSASNPVDPVSIARAPAFAAVDGLVDPSSLEPPPPEGAICRASGQWTICHAELTLTPINEPVAEVPCGTLYETGSIFRRSTRWYNSENKLEKRFVTEDVETTWSLSPEGAEPKVTVTGSSNWTNVYAIPGDLSSGPQVTHGEFTVRDPGFGVIVHFGGLDLPDGTHHGAIRDNALDPAVAAELCAALTQ